MKDEMRSFLTKQREDHPPRMDPLLADLADLNDTLHYPVEGHPSAVVPQPPGLMDSDEVAPHMQRHPRFLTRAREHMSRRLHDVHVRQALEDKVRQTRLDLEKRVAETQ